MESKTTEKLSSVLFKFMNKVYIKHTLVLCLLEKENFTPFMPIFSTYADCVSQRIKYKNIQIE